MLHPPGISVFGIVKIALYNLEGMGITGPDSHNGLGAVVLCSLFWDMGIGIILLQGIFKHPLRLGIDHAFRGQTGILKIKIGLDPFFQLLEIVKIPVLDRHKNPVMFCQTLQGLAPFFFGEKFLSHRNVPSIKSRNNLHPESDEVALHKIVQQFTA